MDGHTELTTSLWRAYQNGSFTDAIVECEGEEFKVHKLILCARSEVFKAAFQSPFKESQTSRIFIEEDSVTFKLALEWMYLSDYTAFGEVFGSNNMVLNYIVKLYGFADKYQIPSLSVKAKEHYSIVMPKVLTAVTATPYPKEVDQHIDGLFNSLALAYSTTPHSDRGLRDLVVTYLRRFGSIIKRQNPGNKYAKEALTKLLVDEPQIALDLVDDIFLNPFMECSKCWKKTDNLQDKVCEDCRPRLPGAGLVIRRLQRD